jgi:flagellar hook-length control protein FliK
MAEARQAQSTPPEDDAAASDTPSPGEAPADTAVTAETADKATELASPLPDLPSLLPGWPPGAPSSPASPVLGVQGDAGAATAPAVLPAAAKGPLEAPAPALPSATPTPAQEHFTDAAAPAAAASPNAARTPPEPRAATPDNALPAVPGAQPQALHAHARTPDAAPAMANLSAPIHTPAFAPALAAQVRWWAHEGVQQAQLTLSPAEMGPVTVKIVLLDQREARIDFTADLAATRHAIESALPVLAAALDESGLKLAGGGVHDGAAQRQALWQQAQQAPHHARGGSATGSTAHSVTTAAADSAARAQGARGLVDLVA